ncbi:MAG TPA: PLP-dependent aminotransferase family protein [Bordetella sp.]
MIQPPSPPHAVAPWLRALEPDASPYYLQIADQIAQAVGAGALRPGDRLPPQRQLAQHLGVDLTTITRGYAEARHRGLLQARGAQGSFVAEPRAELARMIDLSMNLPPPPLGVSLDALIQRGLNEVLARHDASMLMTYHLGGGDPASREAGAAWLAPMLGRVDPQRIAVCSGAQSALAALILSQTGIGDALVTEPLVYPGLRSAAAQLGRRVVAAQADADGLLPDALERACREHGARLLYLNPTLHNPTTRTMPEGRRRDIVRVARALDLQIIEDDPYWLLEDDAPPPLAQLAPERSHYVSTLSKCLTPGLRTAYALLPDAGAHERFLAALRSVVLMSAQLMTGLTTQWMLDGSAARLLEGVRGEARARQALARQWLPATARVPAGGIHVWQDLPARWTPHTLARVARDEGFGITPSDAFCVDGPAPNSVRLSLGGVPDRAQLTIALKKLARLLERDPAASQDIVI